MLSHSHVLRKILRKPFFFFLKLDFCCAHLSKALYLQMLLLITWLDLMAHTLAISSGDLHNIFDRLNSISPQNVDNWIFTSHWTLRNGMRMLISWISLYGVSCRARSRLYTQRKWKCLLNRISVRRVSYYGRISTAGLFKTDIFVWLIIQRIWDGL